MVECDFCGGETAVVAGCEERRLIYGNDDAEAGEVEAEELVTPYRYGEEPRFEGTGARGTCGECNASVGEFHHIGCRIEQCPNCGEKLQFCDCAPDVVTRK
jgi:hypothetical protein